ncbi:hypothetical protein [Pseudomonas sp. IT-347P]|uniref:hypothetical protein n=1 Tax=Pseudomonas sp. IT-347P TaxID=3026458 RepID=UPI0039E0C7EC
MIPTNEAGPERGDFKGIVTDRPIGIVNAHIMAFAVTDREVYAAGGTSSTTHEPLNIVELSFPDDITNGIHTFTTDGAVKAVTYSEGIHSDVKFEGIKNGIGFIYIDFNRKAGTLFAVIVGVELAHPLQPDFPNPKLNVIINAKDLIDNDQAKE